MFVRSAIDLKRYELLVIKATGGRMELEAVFFVREALKYCIGTPIILVDHGP